MQMLKQFFEKCIYRNWIHCTCVRKLGEQRLVQEKILKTYEDIFKGLSKLSGKNHINNAETVSTEESPCSTP